MDSVCVNWLGRCLARLRRPWGSGTGPHPVGSWWPSWVTPVRCAGITGTMQTFQDEIQATEAPGCRRGPSWSSLGRGWAERDPQGPDLTQRADNASMHALEGDTMDSGPPAPGLGRPKRGAVPTLQGAVRLPCPQSPEPPQGPYRVFLIWGHPEDGGPLWLHHLEKTSQEAGSSPQPLVATSTPAQGAGNSETTWQL